MADKVDRSSAVDNYRAAIDAALGGVAEGIACLVRNGADFTKPVPPGEHLDHLPNQSTALLFTATAHALRSPALFSLLLREGAKTDVVDSAGRTPVVLTCRSINEYADTLETLLAAGVSPTRLDNSGYGPIHYAAANGHTRCVKRLIDAGADPDQPAADGSTPLLLASCTGTAAVHRELLTCLENSHPGDRFSGLDERWSFSRDGSTYGALRLSFEDGAWETIALGSDVENVVASVREQLGPIRGVAAPVVLFRFTGKDRGPCSPNPFMIPGNEMRIEKRTRGCLLYYAPRLRRCLPPKWEKSAMYRFVFTPAKAPTGSPRPAGVFPIETVRILSLSEWGEEDFAAVECSMLDDRWIAAP